MSTGNDSIVKREIPFNLRIDNQAFRFFNKEVYSRRHLESVGYHSFLGKNNFANIQTWDPNNGDLQSMSEGQMD